LKPAELLKASTTANPIAEKYTRKEGREKERQGYKQSSQECKNDTRRSQGSSSPAG
jgi:hypothetical protein